MRRVWNKLTPRTHSLVCATTRELPFALMLAIAIAMYVYLVRGYPI